MNLSLYKKKRSFKKTPEPEGGKSTSKNKLVFVVQDKETLLKSISDKGYTIGQGFRQWRGQINSANSFLNYLDTDYRNSLYNHSKLHYDKGNLDSSWKDEILVKKHFSFRNIHQNLGNIRW